MPHCFLSPEWKRAEEASREQAREALLDNDYHRVEIRPLIHGAWCFVQLEVLQKTPKEMREMAIGCGIPLSALILNTAEPSHLSKYLKPFYDALGLERHPGRPPGR
jgi:hypothetical protein